MADHDPRKIERARLKTYRELYRGETPASMLPNQALDPIWWDAGQNDNPRRLPTLRYTLTLPFPPSVNHLWRYVGRGKVIRSPDYEAWLKTGDGCVLEQLGIPAYRRPIRGKYLMELTLDVSRWGKVDGDNCLKAVSDLLQRNNIVENDKNAWKTTVLWGDVEAPNPACRVQVAAHLSP